MGQHSLVEFSKLSWNRVSAITLWSGYRFHRLETILAEKIETLISRGTANTRMRDFYDIYVLENTQSHNINRGVLQAAFANTCKKRDSVAIGGDIEKILDEIESSRDMSALWRNYQRKFDYAADIEWKNIMQIVRRLLKYVQE